MKKSIGEHRLRTIKEALDPESLGDYGFDMDTVKELAAETKVKGIWNNGKDEIFPVFVMGHKGKDWFKSKPSAYTIDRLINFIYGSDPKYASREIIGIFPTLEDAMKVYEALPIRDENANESSNDQTIDEAGALKKKLSLELKPAEFNVALKQTLKSKGVEVRGVRIVNSYNWPHCWIQVSGKMPNELRKQVLIAYKRDIDDKTLNSDNIGYGNVRDTHISAHPQEWIDALAAYEPMKK